MDRVDCLRRSLVTLLVLLIVPPVAQASSRVYSISSLADNQHASDNQKNTNSRSSVGTARHADSTAAGMRQLSDISPKSRVIVVNDIPGHFEVLAGVVHVLGSLGVKPHVLYVGAPNIPVTWGILGWLGEEHGPEWDMLPRTWAQTHPQPSNSGGTGGDDAAHGDTAQPSAEKVISQLDSRAATWQPMQMMGPVLEARLSAQLVLCVSAELAPDVCRQVVDAVQPRQLVVVLHRADALSLNAKVLNLYNRTEMFALAPHVARMSEHKMRVKVAWALPNAPLLPKRGECMQLACLDGFTVQGALRRYRNRNASGYTRNYLQLWERLTQLKASPGTGAGAASPAVRVAVLGKGDRSALGIPQELQQDVTFHSRLPYPEFWGRIHRSLALVPSLGHAEYYLSRITSTVLASLITTTPIIADQRLMDAYEFLGPQHVFLRQPDEDEAAAMYRIASMPEAEVVSRRVALKELRDTLNQKARTLFGQWIERSRV